MFRKIRELVDDYSTYKGMPIQLTVPDAVFMIYVCIVFHFMAFIVNQIIVDTTQASKGIQLSVSSNVFVYLDVPYLAGKPESFVISDLGEPLDCSVRSTSVMVKNDGDTKFEPLRVCIFKAERTIEYSAHDDNMLIRIWFDNDKATEFEVFGPKSIPVRNDWYVSMGLEKLPTHELSPRKETPEKIVIKYDNNWTYFARMIHQYGMVSSVIVSLDPYSSEKEK